LYPAFIKYTDFNRLTRGWPHKRTQICTPTGRAHPYAIPVHQHFFDRQVKIWKGTAKKLNVRFETFTVSVQTRLVFLDLLRKQFVQSGVISFAGRKAPG
jgi:hypothetical protein